MEENNFLLRELTCNDSEAVCEIIDKKLKTKWSPSLVKSTILLKDVLKYGCFFDGKLVSFCLTQMFFDEMHVLLIATLDEFSRCGIAKKLLFVSMQEAKKRGAILFTLEVRSQNAPAIHLYENMGFKTMGIRKNYYEGKTDALILSLDVKEWN